MSPTPEGVVQQAAADVEYLKAAERPRESAKDLFAEVTAETLISEVRAVAWTPTCGTGTVSILSQGMAGEGTRP